MTAAAVLLEGRFTSVSSTVSLIIGLMIFCIVAADKVFRMAIVANHSTVLYGVASALIVLGLAKAENEGTVIGGGRWMQLTGAASYALYLSHYPIISALCKLAHKLGAVEWGLLGACITYIFVLTACLLTAIGLHNIIEKPLMNWLRIALGSKRKLEPAK